MKRFKPSTITFLVGTILVFAVIQVLISLDVINTFWNTILRLAAVMAIVSLGLNLIYGFNGQFSLGQFGFYAIGAYTAADITYRWTQLQDATGLTVILMTALFAGLMIMVIRNVVTKIRGLDTLSAFTMYLTAVLLSIFVAVKLGQLIGNPVTQALNLLTVKVATQLSSVGGLHITRQDGQHEATLTCIMF